MRLPVLSCALVSAATVLMACKPKEDIPVTPPAAVAAPTEEDKTFYAMGAAMAEDTRLYGFSDEALAKVQQGFSDALLNKTLEVKPDDYKNKVREIQKAQADKAGEGAAAEGAAYAAKAAAEPGAVTTDSGMIFLEVKAGTGANPTARDRVKVHYHGTLPGGKVFDSSLERGEPSTFPLNRVIPCWTEGMQRIKVGGKARLVCPPAVAYGADGRPPRIMPNSTLTFDVELLEIVK